MVRATVVGVALAMCTLLVPRAALAQQAAASGIAGVVKDASGAVLPGVTVEAASPALIEKVRTVVTDGEGRFNIVDLRPGAYTVTFSITGFTSFRRDGIELTSGFTATLNVDMKVGALTETVTVSGEAPLVDTRNARKQTIVSSDLLNALPSSVKNLNNLVALTPGFRGNEGFDVTGAYTGQIGGTYHGKGGTNVQFDGMGIQHASGNQGYNANAETVQELAMTTSGISADSNADGAIVNMIPREGGNTFKGGATGLYSNKSLMSDNLSDELIARGLKSVNALNYIYDAGFTLGGPIKKDRLWFFVSFREWGNERQAANKFYNATQHTPFYTPDLTRPAFAKEWYESKAVRLTWRASEKNKFNVFADPQRDCHCPALTASGSLNAPEAFFSYHLKPAGLYQVTWSAPVTNKLLLEAGIGRADGSWPIYRQPEVTPDDISITEQSTGMRYNSGTPTFGPLYYTQQLVPRFSERFSASYITGGHTFKAGMQLEQSYVAARGGERDLQSRVHLQQPGARQPHAVGDPVRAQVGSQGLRLLRPGSVESPADDADLRRPLQLLQRVQPAAERAGHAERVGRGAQLRRGEERSQLEGLRPALRHGVRHLRHRPDGSEGRARPVRLEVGHHRSPGQQPDPDVHQLRHAHVERQLLPGGRSAPGQLQAGLRPLRSAASPASAAPWRTRTSAATSPPPAMPTMRCSATGRAATTGTSRLKSSTSCGPACR